LNNLKTHHPIVKVRAIQTQFQKKKKKKKKNSEVQTSKPMLATNAYCELLPYLMGTLRFVVAIKES
jgi:hypothetical protein